MWTGAFWRAVAERGGKTLAQSLIAAISVAGVAVGFEDIDWVRALSVAGVATVLSILMSIASNTVGASGPSLTTERLTPSVDTHGRHERPE